VVVVKEPRESREIVQNFLNDTMCGFAESIDKSFLKPEGVLDSSIYWTASFCGSMWEGC
jgi:hypothetical protein